MTSDCVSQTVRTTSLSLRPGTSFRSLSGHEAVRRELRLLTALAQQSGLIGCLDHFSFFQSNPYLGSKVPHLVLLEGRSGPLAAVFLYEYRLAGLPLRLFIPTDTGGERAVIAPPEQRSTVAYQAAQFLLGRGALMVMLSFVCGGIQDLPSTSTADRSVLRAWRTRTLLRDLPLESSLDETLARMGSRTRRNLRASMRRGNEAGLCYVQDVYISADEFLRMDGQCAYPVPPHVALWRLRSATEERGGFIVGLRGDDGRWACLAGGRRYRTSNGLMTAVDWQMNRVDLARLSLGTMLRAYLLEGEIARGSSRLRFEGGTPHSMQSAFLPEIVADLVFVQPWMRSSMVRLLGRSLRAGNLLGETLPAADLHWL